MNKNLAIFVELCQEKQIPLRIIHECGNLLEITALTGETFLFTVGATPFNDQSIYQLCKDKEFFYFLKSLKNKDEVMNELHEIFDK